MESSICVAVMHGFPAWTVCRIIRFWAMGTWAAPISTPRSPRATMVPSATAMISSRLSSPRAFSILAMIGMSSPPIPVRKSRMPWTSAALCMKEAAT